MRYMSCGRAERGQGSYLGLEKRFLKTRAMWLGHCIRMDDERAVRRIVVENGQKFNSQIMNEPWGTTLERTDRIKWRVAVRNLLKTEFPIPIVDVKQQRNKSRIFVLERRPYIWQQKIHDQQSSEGPTKAKLRGERCFAWPESDIIPGEDSGKNSRADVSLMKKEEESSTEH